MSKRYEVLGYRTVEDFEQYKYVIVSEDLTLREACFDAVISLGDFKVIKIQDSRREYIKIFMEMN